MGIPIWHIFVFLLIKYKRITSTDALKQAAKSTKGEYAEFFIALAGGMLRSSKRILYNSEKRTFFVNNEIDDTYQKDLTLAELKSQTNIYAAIKAGQFYQYLF